MAGEPWSVHLTVPSTGKAEVVALAQAEQRSAANMVWVLAREAMNARMPKQQESA